MRNCVILGSGPAGCTAAIYLARAGFQPLVLEGLQPGGQLVLTTEVENYPGFPDGILGGELVQAMKRQAEKFGTEFLAEEAEEVDFRGGAIRLRRGDTWEQTQSLLIATGASTRWLDVPGERELVGRGVSSCATCDAAFFRDRKVAVVGGGDTALTEAVFLTRFASKVLLIHRRQGFRAAKLNVDQARANPKIEFVLDSTVSRVLGQGKLSGIEVKSTAGGGTAEVALDGLFVAVGHEPNTGFLKGKVALDPEGHVLTFQASGTSMEGVFAAGDAVDRVYRQAITAAGSGCRAALDIEKYLQAKGL
jgi:thioredoxin reductase (NADPH)